MFRYFQHLSVNGDRLKYDLGAAAAEASQCRDLLSQAQYHVARARRQDDEEKALRRKQDEERQALKQKVVEERQKMEERRRLMIEERVSIWFPPFQCFCFFYFRLILTVRSNSSLVILVFWKFQSFFFFIRLHIFLNYRQIRK